MPHTSNLVETKPRPSACDLNLRKPASGMRPAVRADWRGAASDCGVALRMDDLTTPQLHALRNMARKKAGEDVAFVKIADAQALTELGLAERSREGWDITAAGAAVLARLAPLSSDTSEATA